MRELQNIRPVSRRTTLLSLSAVGVLATSRPRVLFAGVESQTNKAIPDLLVAPFSQTTSQDARKTWAKHLGDAEDFSNRLEMNFVLIPPGKFLMGSPLTEERRRESEKQHEVTISRPFYLSVTEVTQQQWKSLMNSAPWGGKRFVWEGDDFPATYINWDDASEFCRRFTEAEGRTYRLPTEAEWEYACRAGTTTVYSFGDDSTQLPRHGWIGSNTFDAEKKHAQLVGKKRANQLGLHDMHGNVWEWCADWYAPVLREDYAVDPRGPAEGKQRVIRGGSWHGVAQLCRSANRFYRRPAMRTSDVGFRVVASPKE